MRWTPLATNAYQEIATAGPLTTKDLLARLGCARRTLFEIVKNLQAAGLVRQQPNWRDLRQHFLVAIDPSDMASPERPGQVHREQTERRLPWPIQPQGRAVA